MTNKYYRTVYDYLIDNKDYVSVYTAEINSGEHITETAGYIPFDAQIKEFIAAGERLNDFRAGMYDFGPEDTVDEDFEDPTRRPGFDRVDMDDLIDQYNARVAEVKAAQDKAKAEKAEKDKKAEIDNAVAAHIEKSKKSTPETKILNENSPPSEFIV